MAPSMADATLRWLSVESDSPKVLRCLRTVVAEMPAWAQLTLRDRRLQVAVLPDNSSVWAYFPMYRQRRIARHVRKYTRVKATTRIILVIGSATVQIRSVDQTLVELRHHIGHVLLYLRAPRAQNECDKADKEWARMKRG